MSYTKSEIIQRHDNKSGTKVKCLRLYEEDADFIMDESKDQKVRVSDFVRNLLVKHYSEDEE